MATYFISDLHLHPGPESKDNTELFIQFLEQIRPECTAIYILGDLFDTWFGDDLAEPFHLNIFAKLKQLRKLGVPIFVMPGNRDFLLGQRFAKLAGVQLLLDPCVISIYKQKIVLCHGDTLCTKDYHYLRFRSFVRSSYIQKLFLSLPKKLRQKIGNWIRNRTQKAVKHNFKKNPEQFMVTASAVQKLILKYNADLLIHGHIHQAGKHQRRIVLGDWNNNNAIIYKVSLDKAELLDLKESIRNVSKITLQEASPLGE